MQETDIASIFKHIYTIYRKYGVTYVEQKLKELQNQGIPDLDINLIDVVVNEVINEYGITRKRLFDQKKGISAEARKMCYIIIKHRLKLNEKQIAWYFEKNPKVVYRALEEWRKMNESIKFDKEFILKNQKISKKLDTLLKEKIEELRK